MMTLVGSLFEAKWGANELSFYPVKRYIKNHHAEQNLDKRKGLEIASSNSKGEEPLDLG